MFFISPSLRSTVCLLCVWFLPKSEAPSCLPRPEPLARQQQAGILIRAKTDQHHPFFFSPPLSSFISPASYAQTLGTHQKSHLVFSSIAAAAQVNPILRRPKFCGYAQLSAEPMSQCDNEMTVTCHRGGANKRKKKKTSCVSALLADTLELKIYISRTQQKPVFQLPNTSAFISLFFTSSSSLLPFQQSEMSPSVRKARGRRASN